MGIRRRRPASLSPRSCRLRRRSGDHLRWRWSRRRFAGRRRRRGRSDHLVRDPPRGRRANCGGFTRSRNTAQAVRTILPSGRDKSLVSLGGDGARALDYMTSERQLLHLAGRAAAADDRLRPARQRPDRPRRGGTPDGLADRLPASRGQLADALRQGALRRLRRAGVRLADHRRRRFEPKFSLVPLHVRHAERHVLRHALRRAAGAVRRDLRQPLHHARASSGRSSRWSRSWPRCRRW